jgi:hypothetical protein
VIDENTKENITKLILNATSQQQSHTTDEANTADAVAKT